MEYVTRGKNFLQDLIKRGPIVFFETIFGRHTSVLFLGLDNAGKTTLLLRLKTDTIHTVAPTTSVREEKLQIGNMKVTISDLGGHEAARLGWASYFVQSQGIIFMIDITDQKRFELVRETYQGLIRMIESAGRPEMPVAVLFNKTDKWGSYWEKSRPAEIAPALDENYLVHLCALIGIETSDGENGRRVSANYCSVVKDSITDSNKGFMLAFKWLDMMVRATK